MGDKVIKKFKTGDKFIYGGHEFLVTNTQVPGTFLFYAVELNINTGHMIRIRLEKKENGDPLYIEW